MIRHPGQAMLRNGKVGLFVTAAVVYSILVFVLDVISPLGIEIWVLNLPVILLPMFVRNQRLVLLVTAAGSMFVVLGSISSPPGNNPLAWEVLNRGMGLLTLWLIAGLAILLIRKSTQLEDAIASLWREIDQHRQTRRDLEVSEERLRLATEGAGMGTFDVDLQAGRIVSSATHLRILGYAATADRETEIDQWTSCIHPDDLERVLESREEAVKRRTAYATEYRITRADNGEIAWLAVFGRYLYDETGKAVRLLGVAFDITQRKELEREAVQREVLAMAAREQRQIGQELHDGVGQALTGLGLMAQSLAQRLPQAATEQRVANRLVAGIDSVHQQVRELSRGLIPVHVESRGLSAALDDLAATTTEASGIAVTAECPDWVELPDHATATQLFRIAQEAVSNAVRHGSPRHVQITLLDEPTGLRLRIRDDGIGMQAAPDPCNGLGLRIMHYRAGQIGGVLHVGPSLGGGTVVICSLPRSNANAKKCGSGADEGEGPDRG
jgi:PAS domain S-box-containing protein